MSGVGGGGATDVGAIRAGFELDISDGKRKLTEIRTELTTAANSAKQSSKSMREVGDAIKDAAAKKAQLEQLGKSLENVNGRIEQQKKVLKTLKDSYAATFDDGKKTKLEGKILNVEASLNKLTATSDKTARQMWELEDSFADVSEESTKAERNFAGMTSALTALGAGAAATGMAKTVMTLVDEANQLGNALTGVKQVAGALGHDVTQVTQVTEQLASRGVLSLAEAATAVKTALATGYDIDKTVTLINTLTDAAAYNREAHLDWGEAVVTAVQGIKAGNSTLTDAAGITTNLSVMYDKYAKSIGTSAATLTEAQKSQAAYNGMIEEASIFAGNADAALEGYTGTNNAFKKSIEAARVELGEAYLPVIQKITEEITPMIQKFTDWVVQNKEVVAGVTAAGVAITGLIAIITTAITVVGALKIALDALKISLGPAGWVLLGISALATGMTAYSLAADAATESTWKFADSQAELNDRLNESPLTRTADDLRNLQADYDRLNSLVERQKELQAEVNSLPSFKQAREVTAEMQAISDKKNELMRELNEINAALKELGVTASNDSAVALEKMRKEIEASTPAQRELRMETLQQIAAQIDNADASGQLADRYRQLKSDQKLTKEQSEELTSVVRKLTTEYPELHTQLDEQGRLLIVNEELLREQISAEQDTAQAALAAEMEIKQSRIRTTQATITAIQTQIKAFQTLAEAEKPVWGTTGMLDNIVYDSAISAANTKQAELTSQLGVLKELETEVAAIENGTWRGLYSSGGAGGNNGPVTSGSGGSGGGGTSKPTSKQQTAQEIANQSYRESLKYLQYKRDLNQLSYEQELKKLGELQAKYAQYTDIRQDSEVRIYKLKEQKAAEDKKIADQNAKDAESKARAQYEASSEWIEKETRKMTEAGATEREISEMQLTAWTRVRNRYSKDSDYYKRADIAMYNARMSLRKQDEALAKEIATKQKDYVKDTLKSIDAMKKAEIDALDERKKAVQKYYDDLLREVDDNERDLERSKLVAEAEKYAAATSEKGKAHYAEILEQLRKMDVEDQKQALEDERDTKLDALDEQKRDIEDWYGDLKTAADEFNGDMIRIYQLTEDERLKAFISTNEQIKAEMAKFQSDMAALQGQADTASSGSSSVIAQMKANSQAWKSADAAGKKALAAENQSLGASIGGVYNSSSGKWTDGAGLPLFHTGRDGATGQTFSVGSRLMPDELTAILRTNEYVFTPGQLQSLLDAKSSGGGGTTVTIEKVVGLEMHDTVMEDEIDLRAVGRTGNDLAADMLRNKFTRGE